MNRLRRSLLALTAGVVALLGTLFVATATLASSPPHQVGHDGAMWSEMPCAPEATVCAPDCAVLCQALVVLPPMIDQRVGHFRTTYRVRTVVLGSLSVEAEDPPPR